MQKMSGLKITDENTISIARVTAPVETVAAYVGFMWGGNTPSAIALHYPDVALYLDTGRPTLASHVDVTQLVRHIYPRSIVSFFSLMALVDDMRRVAILTGWEPLAIRYSETPEAVDAN